MRSEAFRNSKEVDTTRAFAHLELGHLEQNEHPEVRVRAHRITCCVKNNQARQMLQSVHLFEIHGGGAFAARIFQDQIKYDARERERNADTVSIGSREPQASTASVR